MKHWREPYERLSRLLELQHKFLRKRNREGLTANESSLLSLIVAEVESLQKSGYVDFGVDGSLVVRGGDFSTYRHEVSGGLPSLGTGPPRP